MSEVKTNLEKSIEMRDFNVIKGIRLVTNKEEIFNINNNIVKISYKQKKYIKK